ncbi:hypothetical protein ACFXD5_41020 [Streptomyces sp. NPDC059385]|uniref:hypothetical protein n=1 Tax=Streptomyces sp. NPDC059385 TaxID=3346817 RepID=UPI00369C6424
MTSQKRTAPYLAYTVARHLETLLPADSPARAALAAADVTTAGEGARRRVWPEGSPAVIREIRDALLRLAADMRADGKGRTWEDHRFYAGHVERCARTVGNGLT